MVRALPGWPRSGEVENHRKIDQTVFGREDRDNVRFHPSLIHGEGSPISEVGSGGFRKARLRAVACVPHQSLKATTFGREECRESNHERRSNPDPARKTHLKRSGFCSKKGLPSVRCPRV